MNLYFSAVILVAIIFLIYIFKKRPNIDRILMGAFFLDILVFLPMIIKNDGIYSASSSAIYVLRIFAMEMGFGEFIEEVTTFSSFHGYHVISAVLYVLSPLLAGAFILSFLMDKVKSLQLSFTLAKKMYIFTELHEGSLSLAKTIDKKRAKVIFLCSEDGDAILREECSANGFILIDWSAEKVYRKIRKHIFGLVRNREATLFFIDADENAALAKMLNFMEDKQNSKKLIKTSVFLYSVSDEAELVADSFKAEFKASGIDKITLRVIDNVQITSYQILENYPLYNADCQNDYNVTVIGGGNMGLYFAKDVAWCGQALNRGLKINIVDDRGEDAVKGVFEYKYPELNAENYNINYYGADVCTGDFDKLLQNELGDTSYFMISLPDDEAAIMVAHNIRMKFYRYHNAVPEIVVCVTDNDKAIAVKKVFAKLNIHIAGTNCDLYSMNAIYDHPIYKKAYLVDCAYNKRKGYPVNSFEKFLNLKESVIRSNIAYAIHIDYKLWDMTGINPKSAKENTEEIKKAFNALDPKKIDELNVFEHFRWLTFTRSEGWVSPFGEKDFADADTAKKAMEAFKKTNEANVVSGIDYEQNPDVKKAKLHQSLFSKQHGCIVDFEYLELLDEVMGNQKGDFADYDKTLNEEIVNIWTTYLMKN